MKKKRIVQLVANRNKYTKFAFMAVPRFDGNMNTYLTGQHIIPGVTDPEDGLTPEEMTGEKPLSVEKARKFPYVLNPDNQTPIIHLNKLDLSTNEKGQVINYKDKVLYDFFVKYSGVVAESKDKFIIDKHFFYIRDEEFEAEQRVSKRKLLYKAMNLVQENTSTRKLNDLALMLSYTIKNFSVNPNIISLSQLEDVILKACEDYPEEVIKCYEEGAEEMLFILKVKDKGIIVKRDDAFYDGQMFLGRTIADVLDFMKRPDNEGYLDKWTKLLSENRDIKKSENKHVQHPVKPSEAIPANDMYLQAVSDAFEAIMLGDVEKAKDAYRKAKQSNPSGEKLNTIAQKIEELIEGSTNNKDKGNQDAGGTSKEAVSETLKDKTLDQLKAICKKRKYPIEEWQIIESDEAMRQYIIDKTTKKQVPAESTTVFE